MTSSFIDPAIWEYCLAHTSRQSTSLEQLKKATYAQVHGAQMLSETMVGQLMHFFVEALQPNVLVDVGTYTGLSALVMAEASPWNAKVYTIDRPGQAGRQLAEQAIRQHHEGQKITCVEQNASDWLSTFDQAIDFAFIDADKKQVLTYFNVILERLSDRGMIMIDDVLWRGQVLDPENDPRGQAMDQLNQVIVNHPDLHNMLLPIRHGMQIVQKIQSK